MAIPGLDLLLNPSEIVVFFDICRPIVLKANSNVVFWAIPVVETMPNPNAFVVPDWNCCQIPVKLLSSEWLLVLNWFRADTKPKLK